MTADVDLDRFRLDVVAHLASEREIGQICDDYGSIVPTSVYGEAVRWQARLAETGYTGFHWPTEYGGQGLSRAHGVIWREECARAMVAPYLNTVGNVLAGDAILRSGTDQQKDRFLAATLTAEIFWCQLFSEPGAGSDLAGLQTSAEQDGDRYILNGQKVWASNAQFSQFGILMARTDQHAPKHKGISFFLLDMSLPGIDVRPLKQMTGDEEFCEVFFDDVEMPVDALLGATGDGWKIAMDVLADERNSFGGAVVISLGQQLDKIAAMAIDNDPVTRSGLAALLGRGHGLKTMLERLTDDPLTASAAKILKSELDVDANNLSASIRGPAAMLHDAEAEAFLYAPSRRIAGGTSEIQRNIIGERILGLPREPRATNEL